MNKRQHAERAVREWNDRYSVGAPVVLDPLVKRLDTRTASTAWVLCDAPVISVHGVCGSVSLDRVWPVWLVGNKEKKLKNEERTKGTLKVVPSLHGDHLACVQIGDDDAYTTGDLLKPDAKHIVACVNACAGIENPAALPELLRAAEFAASYIDELQGMLPKSENAELQANGAIIREAIAKLKGGAI